MLGYFAAILGGIGMLKSLIQKTPVSEGAIESRAKQIFRDSVRHEEGFVLKAYYDSLGILTVGIGHKVLPADKIKAGESITIARALDFFVKDTNVALNAAMQQAKDLNKYTAEFISALAHVNYQLGTGWKYKFSNTYALLKAGSYKTAISNLMNSAWYNQTPDRVHNFIAEIRRAYA